MANETQKEREARERAEEQRRLEELRNIDRLRQKVTDFKSRIHLADSEQQHLLRQAAQVKADAEKKAAELIAQAQRIKENVPNLKTRLLQAEHELRLLAGNPTARPSVVVGSVLGI